MEYGYNFQDNILKFDFNNRAIGITNWIKENRHINHPNAYEMTNVFLFAAKYKSEGLEIDDNALKEMWEIRSKDFANVSISENDFVYKICEDAYNASKEGKALVNDENSHHALRKLAGIGLYLRQLEKPQFNNPQELMVLIESAKTLKAIHPDLFEKYGFQANIEVIKKLQLQQQLPDVTRVEIENATLENETKRKKIENDCMLEK